MMIDDTKTLEIDGLPTPVAGHGHGADHRHHGSAHEPHDSAATAFRPPFSLVRLSVGGRLAIALALSAGVWVAVRWALTPIG